MTEPTEHEHCWHTFRGPYMAVLKDGYRLLKCCQCEETKAVHEDHLNLKVGNK